MRLLPTIALVAAAVAAPIPALASETADEERELARAADLPGARVHAHVPFRVALVWERTDDARA